MFPDNIEPTWSQLDKCRPHLADIGLSSANVGQSVSEFGPACLNWTSFGNSFPNLGVFGANAAPKNSRELVLGILLA